MKFANVDRRALVRGVSMAAGASLAGWAGPGWMGEAWAGSVASGRPDQETLTGEDITLRIGRGSLLIGGKAIHAVTINGTVPGPLLRLRQGQQLRLTVINELDEETSLHWHGLLVPFQMDGVPGVSFPGIPAASRFTYDFAITQSGTYWYHSHSGLQELMGQYAPIIIEPAGPDANAAPRDHVVMLSDHSFVHPARILRNLKVDPGHYNRQPQTLAELARGKGQSHADRLTWAKMRMDPTDIADVTGAVLSYLVNGHGPADNWTGLFTPGERVRLRFINAAAMTVFDVRIPGLSLSVVVADGQDVRPVAVEEFQISPGET